ncbi:MAG: hypothetical protein IKJ41_10245 [Clostridia bacterium]|nr:hypothetical protein [Clostridia bacterium]
MKKIIAITTAFLMLFAFASCGENKVKEEEKTEIVTDKAGEAVTNEAGETVTKLVEESETTETTIAESTTVPETTIPSVSLSSDNPTEWTTEEIVEFYKSAAISSKTNVKSKEMKSLVEMVVNDGDGLLGTLVEWATPFLVKALEDSQVEFDGITGGYENLAASDVQSAKAYKSGEYTVVEMKMKEQTDGIHGDRYGGTVGHAISVVGDISSVEEALSEWFDIDFENAKITLRYIEPVLKVKIKDGVIEKGTWSYTIKINVENLHVAAVRLPIQAMVEKAHGEVDYIITVGGGF